VNRYQYLALMAGCLLVTLPLELVLRADVYRRPGLLARTLALPFALFLVWDAIAIASREWTFSPAFVTGVRVPFAIPIEEVVFFVVVPVCTLLTFEVVSRLTEPR
jgi:lycopene beta-cyclase